MDALFDTTPIAIAGYAHVALEQGIDIAPTGLTYAVPQSLASLAVGERVLVPLGKSNRLVPGYVIELHKTSDVKKAKAIASRDEQAISLTPDLIELARWVAAYYCCPLGMVLVSMLPAAVKRGTGTTRQLVVRLAEATETNPPAKLSKLQQAVLDAARTRHAAGEAWTEIKHLADLGGARTVNPVKQLIDKGLLEAQRQSVVRAAAEVPEGAEPLAAVTLNEAQQHAVTKLTAALGQGFSVHLLHGITGSGKTEVYLRVMGASDEATERRSDEREGNSSFSGSSEAAPAPSTPSGAGPRPSTLSAGTIVLVPELSLTPQTQHRFIARFAPGRVAMLHSGLTAAQRHEQWRRIRSGEADIVIGARSAVFAPVNNLGLIIVDEEHDSIYKQDQAPRYHARDVAIKRAQILGVPVILGSATPSLESYFNAGRSDEATKRRSDEGADGPPFSGSSEAAPAPAHSATRPLGHSATSPRYHYLPLPARVAGLKLPAVQVVDMREQRRKRYQMTGKGGIHLLSLPLEMQLRQTLESPHGQALLLLNRRGYANYIACPDHGCGWMMNCEFCDSMMVFHKDPTTQAGGYVECHHCHARQLLVKTCPTCGKTVTVFGLGTQRVEEEVARKFPGAAALRMDSDTMRTGSDFHQTLEAFRRGEVRLLMGTQMIAKGLDFPNVRLVGVISGDTALHMPDFRASERTFQMIAQVAGRTGRGDHPGLVIVQTFNPDDPAIQLAAQHDYQTFARREIEVRRQVGLPPVTRLARIVVRDRDHLAALQQTQTLVEHLQAMNAQFGEPVRIRGPMACPIARIADYHRQQIEMIAPRAADIQKLLTALRNARLLRSDLHTAVDVDPVAML